MNPLQNQTISGQPVVPPSFPSANVPDHNVLNGNNHKKVGPIVVALIVVIIIVIIALFVLASNVNKGVMPVDQSSSAANINTNATITNPNATPSEQITAPAAAPAVQPVTGTSDDLNSLQSDLNASTNGVDAQGI